MNYVNVKFFILLSATTSLWAAHLPNYITVEVRLANRDVIAQVIERHCADKKDPRIDVLSAKLENKTINLFILTAIVGQAGKFNIRDHELAQEIIDAVNIPPAPTQSAICPGRCSPKNHRKNQMTNVEKGIYSIQEQDLDLSELRMGERVPARTIGTPNDIVQQTRCKSSTTCPDCCCMM